MKNGKNRPKKNNTTKQDKLRKAMTPAAVKQQAEKADEAPKKKRPRHTHTKRTPEMTAPAAPAAAAAPKAEAPAAAPARPAAEKPAKAPKKDKEALREEILKQPSKQEITGSKKKKTAYMAVDIVVLVIVRFLRWKGGIYLVNTYIK